MNSEFNLYLTTMCGIAGIYHPESQEDKTKQLQAAVECLSLRGPDSNGIYNSSHFSAAHTRLSIIDLSENGHQPMLDTSGRYVILLNGEIYNHQELRKELKTKGYAFRGYSDTEVVLYALIDKGISALSNFNGFFALAFYDSFEKKLILARDRYGVKPLLYSFQNKKLCFASEMKALLRFGLEKKLNYEALYSYLQLNYIPGPLCAIEGISKLLPGHYLEITESGHKEEAWYDLPQGESQGETFSKDRLLTLLDAAVKDRLVADVPLGAFLSGGIDSSLVVALASRHVKNLKTFTIGYSDEQHFDESRYAELLAKKYASDHTTIKVKQDDLLSNVPQILDYTDEPFADSSAIAVYILSREVKKHLAVALSGDGADELFGGYNKHRAIWWLSKPAMSLASQSLRPFIQLAGKGSRNSSLGNYLRKLHRLSASSRLSSQDRYWRLASITDENDAAALLKISVDAEQHELFKYRFTSAIDDRNLNSLLYADMKLVLPNDMLTKVDLMSMANGLEVRNPFLDYRLVEYAMQLKASDKFSGFEGKRPLRDLAQDLLPQELLNRPKMGFEVPLLKWLRTDLKPMLDHFLSREYIIEQGIFREEAVSNLRSQLMARHPGDSAARIWGLLVFQHWWEKYFKD